MPEPLAPLAQRVATPEPAELPEHPDVASWRPLTVADLDALMVLQEAMDALDHPNYARTRAEVRDDLTHASVDLDDDSIAAIGHDGAILAWGAVSEHGRQETLARVFLAGGVDPAHRGRGLGGAVLSFSKRRALARLSRNPAPLPGWIMFYADERAASAIRLATRSGFEQRRYFTVLERDLAEPIEDVAIRGEASIRALTADDVPAALAAYDDAFQDHWGSQPRTRAEWDGYLHDEAVRGELSVVATIPGSDGSDGSGGGEQVVGFVITERHEADWPRQGFRGAYVALVGVVREHRGERIAPAMLTAVLRACRDAGLERVELDVDSENPSGAVGLYSALGFRPTWRSVALVAEV